MMTLRKALRKATCECAAIPVCCGTAYRNKKAFRSYWMQLLNLCLHR